MEKLNAGPIILTVDGEDFEMTKDDFLIETKTPEGLSTQTGSNITVALSTVLTDELIEEGYVREIISKIQAARRETEGLEVVDRIRIVYGGNEKLSGICSKYKDEIASAVLAVSFENDDSVKDDASVLEKDVNGEKIFFTLRKAE